MKMNDILALPFRAATITALGVGVFIGRGSGQQTHATIDGKAVKWDSKTVAQYLKTGKVD
jgi:hypothetical protein